jgi:hypothetical protein
MRKNLLLLVAVVMATSASAQYYVSASGGISMSSAGILTGTSLNADQSTATNHYGSYGEGITAQLRGGYFFNKTFGVEVALGYLNGADQVVDTYKNYYATSVFPIPNFGDSAPATLAVNDVTKATAHARAYGFSAALIYNFNEHIYGKFGAVTKVGGKTVAEGTNVVNVTLTENVYIPESAPEPYAGAVAIPAGTPVKTVTTTVEQEYHGRIPLGLIAAMGYKYNLSDNLNLFAELEYLGINVTRDTSEYTKYTSTDVSALGAPTTTTTLTDLPASSREITYVDSLSNPNTDSSKALSSVAPYSSFGINFGITYTFGKK